MNEWVSGWVNVWSFQNRAPQMGRSGPLVISSHDDTSKRPRRGAGAPIFEKNKKVNLLRKRSRRSHGTLPDMMSWEGLGGIRREWCVGFHTYRHNEHQNRTHTKHISAPPTPHAIS